MKQLLYLVMSLIIIAAIVPAASATTYVTNLSRVDTGIFAWQMVAPEQEQVMPSRYEINQENVEA
jgi:hypothetical protein